MKRTAQIATISIAGVMALYGILLLLIETEWIAPARLYLFVPLSLLWIAICSIVGISTTRGRK